MILTINKNLFDDVSVSGSDNPVIIAHGCNAQGKMNSGFAKAVRNLNENVYNVYLQSGHKLGTVSYFELYKNVFVANCVTQQFYGYDGKKYTSYDAIDSCFKEINQFCKIVKETQDKKVHLLFPKIGAVLGGGDLEIINKIIDINVDDNFSTKIQYVI